jgi:hypothetical protein
MGNGKVKVKDEAMMTADVARRGRMPRDTPQNPL